jgi:ParB family transcriptional regulator, chromosome partitioning protein
MLSRGISDAGVFENLWLKDIKHSSQPLRLHALDIRELALSIQEKGLLEPLVVRPVEHGFEVVAGNRRLDACRLLGMKKVPCHVEDMGASEAFEASLVENVQRMTLNPLEEATAFRKYVKDYGYGGVSDLARKIGKNESYVSRRMALLDLPLGVRHELMRGRITAAAAQELLSLEDEDQIREAAEAIEERKLTRDEVRLYIRQSKGLDEVFPTLAKKYERRRRMDKVIAKFLVSMEVCLARMDEALDSIEDEEWVVKETLSEYRRLQHTQIDGLIKVRASLRKRAPPLVNGNRKKRRAKTIFPPKSS